MALVSTKERTPGEPYFKPVEGGFLFETFNPWLFAPGRRYIVNDEQRQALIVIMRPQRPILLVALITSGVIVYTCGVSLIWWALSPRGSPNTLDVIGLAVTLLVPLYVCALIAIRFFLKRIDPIVSQATPTHARLSVAERYRAVGDAMSTKLLAVNLTVWTFSFATNLFTILGRRNAQLTFNEPRFYLPSFGIAMSFAFAFLSAWALFRRFRGSKGL